MCQLFTADFSTIFIYVYSKISEKKLLSLIVIWFVFYKNFCVFPRSVLFYKDF